MIRFTRELLLGVALMATGYALTRIGRWMQQVPVKPRRPVNVYEAKLWQQVVFEHPGFADWHGQRNDPERWN